VIAIAAREFANPMGTVAATVLVAVSITTVTVGVKKPEFVT
jgi:hypothetical protein